MLVLPSPPVTKIGGKLGFWLIHVILPLLLGGLIYLLGRDLSSLHMAAWLPAPWQAPVFSWPDWVKYQLPDGLWLYAVLQALRGVWGGSIDRMSMVWYSIALILALGSEMSQAIGWLPGTFDLKDLAIYLFVTLIFLLQVQHSYPDNPICQN